MDVQKDRTLKLSNGKTIIFNDQQYEGVNKIRKFLPDKSKRIFVLSGFAGVGKTSVIKKIIDEFRGNLCVSAPTHKAKKVISSTTGVSAETLHSLLGLRPDLLLDDFNPNNPTFNPIAQANIGLYHLVIIDEASMINKDLYELIYKETKRYPNCKIIYMGDIAQIPPIGEKESVVFTLENVDRHHMTQLMRQVSDNPLIEIYNNLRNNLTLPNGGFERKTAFNDNGEGVLFTSDKREFRELIKEKFTSKEYKSDSDYAKLIAWRNETVSYSNQMIREFIYDSNANIVENGDVLMAYKSVRSKQQYFNIVDNSVDYNVINVSKRHENKHGIYGYLTQISETLPNGKKMNRNIFIVDHSDLYNLYKYADIHDTLKDISKLKKEMWKKYYGFRRDNFLMCDILKYEDGRLRDNTEVITKDIDYGYAITSHKAQGSTYSHVFILENDMSVNPKIKEQNQIKYVAFTRPSKTATVLTNLN